MFEKVVNVIGPFCVDGVEQPFMRASSRELVAYLALHPRGVTNGTWMAALWPGHEPALSSVHSTVSSARRTLGPVGIAMDDPLPRRAGRLLLHHSIGTDWRRFQALARHHDGIGALELVRGRPFADLHQADWSIFEGMAAAIECRISDVAFRVGEEALRRGDGELARWAARQGLRASPWDERLFRVLLVSADLEGNRGRVASVMTELTAVLGGLDEVAHPATVSLYQELCGSGT